MGDWTNIEGQDGAFRAYVARPSGQSKGTVVLAQEIFGVNAVMRGKADWLASEGFWALAPDLFWRLEKDVDITDQSEAEWAKAMGLMKRFNVDAGVRDMSATIAAARGWGAKKVGVMGYCLGGLVAYLCACRTDCDASVAYHGGGIHMHLDEGKSIKKPLLMHNAAKDAFIPASAQDAISAAFAGNPLVTIYTYADVDHAFTREGGAHYHHPSKQLADGRTIAFLTQNLA